MGVVEKLKLNDIVFCLSVLEMGWHEARGCGYKGVEVRRVNGNTKIFLCVRKRKSLETTK